MPDDKTNDETKILVEEMYTLLTEHYKYMYTVIKSFWNLIDTDYAKYTHNEIDSLKFIDYYLDNIKMFSDIMHSEDKDFIDKLIKLVDTNKEDDKA